MSSAYPAAARTPLEALLRPASIAIVGATDDPTAIGGAPLANLQRFGYSGRLHLVSRSRTEIDGMATVSSVAELPEAVDAAVLAVPGHAVIEVLDDCGQRGVRSAVVFSAGFAEVGGDGLAAQEELAAVAAKHGMAVAGPNCLGLVNFVDGVPLTFATTEPYDARSRPAIGMLAQSGAMTMGLTYAAQAAGLPVSYAISTGNEAVVGLEDYLEFLVDDEHTAAIGLLAEQIRQVPRMRRLARRAAELNKPVVLLQLGRSVAGRRSAATHTGALAGDYEQIRTVLQGDGVVVVESLDEIIDVAQALVRRPAGPQSPAAAVITDSGAVKTLCLDQAEAAGLELARLAPGTVDRLREQMPAFATATNPADITAQGLNDPTLYTRAVETMVDDPAVGMISIATMIGSPSQTLQQVQAVVDGLVPSPAVAWYTLLGGDREVPPAALTIIREAGLPLLRSTDRAVRAMTRVAAWNRARTDIARMGAVNEPARSVGSPGRPDTLPEHASKQLLAGYGIAVPDGALVATPDGAVAAAARIGYPVVVKAQVDGVTHKTELGAVAVGLAGPGDLRAAVTAMVGRLVGHRLEGFLVEAMAPAGVELIVGARRDPDWGVTLLVGLGGVLAETLNEVRLLPARIDATMAERAIRSLRGSAMLDGVRGDPPLDVPAAAHVLVHVSDLMRANPNAVELDINPLRVLPHGALALDATLVLDAHAD